MLTAISRVSNQASSKPLIYLFNAWGRSDGRHRALCLSISTPEDPEPIRATHTALGWIIPYLDAGLTLHASSPGEGAEGFFFTATTSFLIANENHDLHIFLFHFIFLNFPCMLKFGICLSGV